MSHFKAKMLQIGFRLGLCPKLRWESLQRSPRAPSWISGVLLLKEERDRQGKEGEKEGMGKDKGGEGKKEKEKEGVEGGGGK